MTDYWDQLTAEIDNAAPERRYQHYRPLADAAEEFISEAQDNERFYLGIEELDQQMRGVGASHLLLLNGFTHSGKTQVALHSMRHNRHKRVLMYTADEPASLVLAKLAAMTTGVGARELEERIMAEDREAMRLMREVATTEFPNLIVISKPLSPIVIEDGYEEACEVWSAEPEVIFLDYVELIQAGDSVQAKFDYLKSFGIRKHKPLVALHQTSRSAGADGREMTISSGAYGGEQHATFVVGVRRKKYALLAEIRDLEAKLRKGGRGADDAAWRLSQAVGDLAVAEYTVTINLVKSKRPGSMNVDEIDMELALSTGRLYRLRPDSLPTQYKPARRASTPIPPPTWTEPELDYDESTDWSDIS